MVQLRSDFGAPVRACLLSLWVGLCGSPLAAQLPQAGFSWIFPAGGQQGTTVQVQVGGADLDDARRIDFSHPGITALPQLSEPDPLLGERHPQPGRFTVTLAGDVPAGIYEARVVGRYGISNARGFVVEDRPQQLAPEAAASAPAEIPLDTWVDGRCRPGQIDHYKVALKQGQRVIIDCWAQRVDSALDASLTVEDSRGRLLAASRDRWHRDPLTDFTAPESGHYIIKLHDSLYGGGEQYGYRLLVSSAPYLDFVFPPAGPAGSTHAFTLYGYNLPGSASDSAHDRLRGHDQLEQANVAIALPESTGDATPSGWGSVAAGLPTHPFRLVHEKTFSNALQVGLATLPIVVEAETNDLSLQSQVVAGPCEIAGQFFPEADTDWFQFQAAKDEAIWLEVFSERLGLPTDPQLLVQRVEFDASGAVSRQEDLHEVDDAGGGGGGPGFDRPTRDPSLLFVAPADGTYRLMVRDLEGSASAQPRHVYRLTIRPPQPDFQLVCTLKQPIEDDPQKPRRWNPDLRRGGRLLLRLAALRREGFAGEIRLTAENLPAGVTCQPTVIHPASAEGVLVLEASEDAPVWEGPLDVLGTSTVGEGSLRRRALTASLLWDADARIVIRPESRLCVAVVDEIAPLRVETAAAEPVRVTKGNKLSIPLKITRGEGAKGDLTLQPMGLPKEIQAQAVTIKEGTSEAMLELSIAPQTQPGDYTLLVTGRGNTSYRRNPEAAEKAAARKQAIAAATAEITAAVAVVEKERMEVESQVEQIRSATSAAAGQLEQLTASRDELVQKSASLAAKAQTAAAVLKEAEQQAAQLAEAAKPADRAFFVVSNAVLMHVDE